MGTGMVGSRQRFEGDGEEGDMRLALGGLLFAACEASAAACAEWLAPRGGVPSAETSRQNE
jgi:hypothetical protein